MAIGKRIQQRLEELDWSAAQLVARVPGMTKQALSIIIQRDSTRSRFAEEIAKALGLTMEDLLFGSDKHPSAKKGKKDDAVAGMRRARVAAWFRKKPFLKKYDGTLSRIVSGKLKMGRIMASTLEEALEMPYGYLRFPLRKMGVVPHPTELGNVDQVIQDTLTDLNALIPFHTKLPENDGEKEIPATFTLNEAAMLVAYRKCSPEIQAITYNLLSYKGSRQPGSENIPEV
jgi:transcriptional regulator with XRE-family HTH domain